MKLLRPILLIFIFSSIYLIGCKKDADPCCDASNPKCENYDPCLGKRTVNTYFNVRPGDRGFPAPPEWCNLVPTDTFNASSVRFDAPEGNLNSTYEWQIGTELNKRFGNGFEVDFNTYLDAGNWESFINITLTIRTPPNNCLSNLDDTLVTVSRNLFFTESNLFIQILNEKHLKYKGYFQNNLNDEVIFELIKLDTGSFRGINAPISLTIGIPGIDTLALTNCELESCVRYNHSITKVNNPGNCIPKGIYLSKTEWIFIENTRKIKRIWEFSPPQAR